jgi:pyruvate formate lyase activating enzyme
MPEAAYEGRWWHRLPDGRIQCDLCPRDCRLDDGQPGHCFVRRRDGDRIVLTTYGLSSGLALDPIEKKPLAHFFPGSSVLSFGTAGCNLACRFCQNWDISKSRDAARLHEEAPPEAIARAAVDCGARSVAFTYNDPVIFAEYAMDTADACHVLGVRTVAVTAGYVRTDPRAEIFSKIDAANVDVKAFTEAFYHRVTGAHLAPVLETLVYLRRETDVWLEITTLLIPGHNDSPAEISRMCDWILRNLGDDVPHHFSAFHPDFRMLDVPPTPLETLRRARSIALEAGLKYVYTGNLRDPEGETTFCPACRRALIVRDRYTILRNDLTPDGRCPTCSTPLPGRF